MIIDISRYNRVIDFPRAKAAGVVECICRAGVGFNGDPFYARNYQRAKAAGMKVGTYYVPNWSYDAMMQVEALAALLDGVGWKKDTEVWIDCEVTNGFYGVTLRNAIQNFLARLETYTGLRPGIYTGRWWWDPNIGTTTWAGKYPLWTAAYTPYPLIPKGWTAYAIWQYSETGVIDGIPGSTDLNRRV